MSILNLDPAFLSMHEAYVRPPPAHVNCRCTIDDDNPGARKYGPSGWKVTVYPERCTSPNCDCDFQPGSCRAGRLAQDYRSPPHPEPRPEHLRCDGCGHKGPSVKASLMADLCPRCEAGLRREHAAYAQRRGLGGRRSE